MPQPAGWAIRDDTGGSSTDVVQGENVSSLNLPVPATRVLNDLLVMVLGHKSTGYATVPVAWTLVAQQIQGPVRAEVYMKRASASEPATYTVSGLGGMSFGGIVLYTGAALADPLFDVGVTGTFLPMSTTLPMTPPLTTLTPWSLIIGVAVWEDSSSFTLSAGLNGPDPSCTRMAMRREIYINFDGTLGGKLHWAVYDVLKHQPGLVGSLTNGALTGQGVGMLLAFRAETAAGATAGTRYYLSAKHPLPFIKGLWPAAWESDFDGPRLSTVADTPSLTQFKPGGGARFVEKMTSNHTPSDLMFGRWMTPPLAAQTFAGTFQLLMVQRMAQQGSAPACHGQLRVHVYVTQGQTTDLRGTLLGPYTDATLFDQNTAFGDYHVTKLASPQTLASVTCLDGDAIVVEVGVHLTADAPWPVPRRPTPNTWVQVELSRGTTWSSGSSFPASVTGVGVFDARTDFLVFGGLTGWSASFLDFSQTIVELPPPTTPIPTNSTWPTAKVITGAPIFEGPIDTSRIPVPARPLWYKWTADRDGRVIIHTWQTTGSVQIFIYTDPSTTPPHFAHQIYNRVKNIYTSQSVAGMDVLSGEVYYIQITINPLLRCAPEDGRLVYLTIEWTKPLQHNDVILPVSGYIARYTSTGVLADLQTDFSGYAVTGAAIDYSRRPMVDIWDDSTHTGERLYLGLFGNDMIEVLDLETLDVGRGEIDYWWQDFDINYHGLSSVAMTRAGLMVIGYFGNGFTRVADGSASYQAEVATLGTASLNVLDGLQTFGQTPTEVAAPVYPVQLDVGGTNYVELAADEQSVFYTSGGWYFPVGGQTIYRATLAGVQLAPFATIPPGPGRNPGLKGLFPLVDGGCLVCNGGEVVRLDSTGAITRHYTPTPSALAQSLADVELDSDGNFWVVDEMSSTLFKFNLASGEQLITLWTALGSGSLTSLVVYRRPPVPPDPTVGGTACPADFVEPVLRSRRRRR